MSNARRTAVWCCGTLTADSEGCSSNPAMAISCTVMLRFRSLRASPVDTGQERAAVHGRLSDDPGEKCARVQEHADYASLQWIQDEARKGHGC